MEEANQFIQENRETPYSLKVLNREDSVRFVEVCRKNNLHILGFDGFHRRSDLGPNRVQIDTAYSRDFSELDKNQAYSKALDFFDHHSEDIIYEFVYNSN